MNSLERGFFQQIAILGCKLCRVAVESGRKSSEVFLQNSWKILEVQHDLKRVDSVVRWALLLRQRGKPHVSLVDSDIRWAPLCGTDAHDFVCVCV